METVRVVDVLDHVLRVDEIEGGVGKRKPPAQIQVDDVAATREVVNVRVEPAVEVVVAGAELQVPVGVHAEVRVDLLRPPCDSRGAPDAFAEPVRGADHAAR